MKHKEGRLVQRINIEIPVFEELISGKKQRAHTINLSETGMRYLKPHNDIITQTNEALLEFMLPNDTHPICACGWIIEEICHEYFLETAVSFVFLLEKDRSKIRNFIREQQADTIQNQGTHWRFNSVLTFRDNHSTINTKPPISLSLDTL